MSVFLAQACRPGNLFDSPVQQLPTPVEAPEDEYVPGGVNTVDHVLRYVRSLPDYGWNELIAEAVETRNYGAAVIFCAQARSECLQRERESLQQAIACRHFSNYMRFWMLEGRIERLNYKAKHPVAYPPPGGH